MKQLITGFHKGIIKKRPPLIWYIKVPYTLTKSIGDLL